MRSTHSLAFQQFEETISLITIKKINPSSIEVKQLLSNEKNISGTNGLLPFKMEWSLSSEYTDEKSEAERYGSCLLIPIPINKQEGRLIRSVGYAEKIQSISKYHFSSEGTLILETTYDQSIVEEKIWFISNNVRCRASIIKTSEGSGILQTSFSSEIRLL